MRDNSWKTVYKKGKEKHQESGRVNIIFSLSELLEASMASGVNVTKVQHSWRSTWILAIHIHISYFSSTPAYWLEARVTYSLVIYCIAAQLVFDHKGLNEGHIILMLRFWNHTNILFKNMEKMHSFSFCKHSVFKYVELYSSYSFNGIQIVYFNALQKFLIFVVQVSHSKKQRNFYRRHPLHFHTPS